MEILLDAYWLNVVVGVVLPILVALVTKQFASSAAKSITLVFLTVLGSGLVQAQEAGGFITEEAISNSVAQFVIAVAAYYGVWKPTRVAGADGRVAAAVPGGIG